MIAITKQPRQTVTAQQNERFLEMLPLIRSQARLAFHRLRPELKNELVQEVVANAYCAFAALVSRGKVNIAYATPLANYAIRQVIAGRRVGTKLNSNDVSSVGAQRQLGFTLQNIPSNGSESDSWSEILADDTLALRFNGRDFQKAVRLARPFFRPACIASRHCSDRRIRLLWPTVHRVQGPAGLDGAKTSSNGLRSLPTVRRQATGE